MNNLPIYSMTHIGILTDHVTRLISPVCIPPFIHKSNSTVLPCKTNQVHYFVFLKSQLYNTSSNNYSGTSVIRILN